MEQIAPELNAKTEPVRKAVRWGPALLGWGFLLLYLKTLCPTVYLGDSGEIATAIATGGVVHPPGYPLFSLLGRAALFLVPFGEPAFRIGCVVALAAALAVVILFHLARELGASVPASLLAAAAFGTSYTFWSQSTRVEVYSLHVLLASCALLGALRYRRTGAASWLWACAGAVTLGLAHHLTIVLLGPALLILCGKRLWTDPQPLRRWLPALALVPVGPALYLLLMLWARAEPLQNWGRPVTFNLLWNHATAKIYQGLLALPEPDRLERKLRELGSLYLDNFPLFLAVLPPLGATLLWKRDRPAATALLVSGVVICVYNLCYRIADVAGYYLMPWLFGALALALALDAIGRHLPRVRPAVAVVAGAGLVVGVPLVRNWTTCDLSRATWVREFARHKLENTDPDGVLVSHEDPDTFPLWYTRDLLGIRRDVLVLDYGLCRFSFGGYDRDPSQWFLHRLRRDGVEVSLTVPDDPAERDRLEEDGFLVDLLEGPLKDRPLCVTFLGDTGQGKETFRKWALARMDPLPQGVVLRYHPRSQPPDLRLLLARNERLWSRIELPPVSVTRTDQEYAPDYVVNHYAAMLVNYGHLYELAGRPVEAAAIYQRVTEWAPRYEQAQRALRELRQGKD